MPGMAQTGRSPFRPGWTEQSQKYQGGLDGQGGGSSPQEVVNHGFDSQPLEKWGLM